MVDNLGPWAVRRYACDTRRYATLQLAKDFADRAYRLGIVELEHETTGEQWKRKLFTWSQTRPPAPLPADPAPADLAGDPVP